MKIAKDLQNWKSWIRFFKMVLFLIPRLSTLSCSLKGRTLEKWQSETMRPTNLWKWWVLTSAELKSKMKKVKWVVYHPGSAKKKGRNALQTLISNHVRLKYVYFFHFTSLQSSSKPKRWSFYRMEVNLFVKS